MRVKMREAGGDHEGQRGHDSGKEYPSHAGHGADVAPQQHDQQQTNTCRQEAGARDANEIRVQTGKEKRSVLGKSDASRRDGKRRAESKLPNIEKRNEAAGALGTVDFPQKNVRSARF